MSKFSKLLENTFEKQKLRRVRLKTDPLYAASEEFSKFQGYEGYVLAENEKTMKIYFECDGGSMVDIPIQMVNIQSGLSRFEKLKLSSLFYLKQNKMIQAGSRLVDVIIASSNIDELILFLCNNGCTAEDLVNIFKQDYEEV